MHKSLLVPYMVGVGREMLDVDNYYLMGNIYFLNWINHVHMLYLPILSYIDMP